MAKEGCCGRRRWAGDLQVIDRLLAIIRQRTALFGEPGTAGFAEMGDEGLRRVLLGKVVLGYAQS